MKQFVSCFLPTVLSGPTHVLVVRGLDENADEEMLRYEFSKHAPIKVQMVAELLKVSLFTNILFTGSSTCQRQIYTCFKGICICTFSFCKLIFQ